MTRPQTSNRHRLLRTLVLAVVTLASVALATPVLAAGFLGKDDPDDEPTKPSWAVPAKRMPVEGEGAVAMEAQLQNAKMRVDEAQQNAVAAEYNLTRARTRRYPRGEALEEIKTRVAEMGKEKSEAERDFVKLVEEARAEGVPAGTLMPYMDLSDEIRRRPKP